jgi:hypothetical protein
MKLTEKEHSATTRVAVMGLSGTGKSTLVAKLAERYRLHWFSLDNDADILFKLPKEWQENIELFDIPDSASYPVASDTMMKFFKNKKVSICHEHGKVSCLLCQKNGKPSSDIDATALDPKKDIVVIDTASQLSHSVLAHVLQGKPVDYKPEFDDWGSLRKWTEFYCTEFQAAKFNLVCIFHAIEATLEDERVKLVPSFGSRDMSSKVGKAFSHIVYTDVKNKKHVAFSASTYSNNVLTKSRTDFEIEKLGEPSLLPIFDGLIPQIAHVESAIDIPKMVKEQETKSSATLQAALERMKKK